TVAAVDPLDTQRSNISGSFAVENSVMQFDSSALPDNLVICRAALIDHVTSQVEPDGLLFSSGWYFYTPTPTCSDYTEGVETSANTGISFSGAPPTNLLMTMELSSPNGGNVNPTTTTSLRLTETQLGGDAAPAGTNEVLVDLSTTAPVLRIEFV